MAVADRSRSKLTTRDYKHARRGGGFGGIDFGRYREFATGLGVGLVIAAMAYVAGRTQGEASKDPARPEPQKVSASAPSAEAEEPTRDYDFYQMLPNFEVVVPEKDNEVIDPRSKGRDGKKPPPNAPIDRPGVYVLQAGSYRNVADADRVRAQLERQGVDAKVQRVAVDSDEWHRVRIGPITDLAQLNRLRKQLRDADVDALVIRVGD